MLVELGLVEQRYKAVLEVLEDGASVTDVAQRRSYDLSSSTPSTTSGAISPAKTSTSDCTAAWSRSSPTQCSWPPTPASIHPSSTSRSSAKPSPPRAARPSTHSAVIRKVDKNGAIRFAGTAYFVGQAHCRHQVEVAPRQGHRQIWGNGRLLRTHPIRHDRRKQHFRQSEW